MKTLITILLLLASATYSQNQFRVRGNSEINNFGNAVIEANNTRIIVEQNAKLNNSGTIQVKDRNDVSQQAVGVQFFGVVENDNGFLDFNYYGSSTISQAAIGGRVRYSSDIGGAARQFIPLIQYDSVIFAGSRKTLQIDQNNARTKLIAKENFTSTNSVFEYDNNVEIESHKHTEHDSRFENSFDEVTFAQTSDSLDARVNGTGQFKHLIIDNPNGVDITRGGFEVENRLELIQGRLNNSASANFIMSDSSVVVFPANFQMMEESGIYRQAASSLNIEPETEGTILVQYEGNAPMESGPEIPTGNDILTDLNILNEGGVTFTKDVFVRDRMEIASNAYMDHNGNENTLYYLSPDDSGINFSNTIAEVYGTMARSNPNLPTDSRLTFNNAYTYMQFNTDNPNIDADLSSDGGLVDTVFVRVLPGQSYSNDIYGDDSELKVQRKFELSAKDNAGNQINQYNNASLGYAWRHDDDTPKAEYHETRDDNPDIVFDELGLQRFDPVTGTWIDEPSQIPANYDPINDWAFGVGNLTGPLGEFAVGVNIQKYLAFVAQAILEGPYQVGTDTMSTFLSDLDIFPKNEEGLYILPTEYPFESTWIPTELRPTLESIPEDVVDWVLIEFRNGQETSTESFYKPCFLRKDGVLVDTVGNENILVWEEETGGIDVTGSTPYYVAIHHRNHMAVVTNNQLTFSSDEDNPAALDFTSLLNIYNSTMAVKFIDLDDNGEKIYALYGGNSERTTEDIDFRQVINDDDTNDIDEWINRKTYLLYLRADTNLDGLVNAKDFNISWNNKNSVYVDSFVK